ncbi:Hypothetical predicted protein [Cloeon dipterum]|uniref:Repulsive guidance molecule C-terminal domain-containing protein n=1 Tax=Cloeon dipterum TaxID=197152 RepID=A0A8S1D087_9INSE|nr:Hypothetical predicted protein [Cloeon dipterum]
MKIRIGYGNTAVRGNISHRTLASGLFVLNNKYNCHARLKHPQPEREEEEQPVTEIATFEPQQQQHQHQQHRHQQQQQQQQPLNCSYQGTYPQNMRHCGLFGDPHLKTFHGQFQTCRVLGAWPLIDTKYLAVTVTNVPVRPGSAATVTSKITVIVKGGVSPCTREKVYEAHVDHLPGSFADGSNTSGEHTEHSTKLKVLKENEHVEISVRHLGVLISVRRHAGALSFSGQLPEDLAMGTGVAQKGSQQLCANGCPVGEQFTSSNDATEYLAIFRETALSLCEGRGLSPTYLEWCVFDVMTTSDKHFAETAKAAQDDVILMDPMADAVLSSVAQWPISSAPRRTAVWPALAMLLIALAAWR